jgi:hypothetical protein
MREASVTERDDDELSEQDLEVVIGGLDRAWRGAWDAAELGPRPAAGAGSDGRPAIRAELNGSSSASRDP